MGTYRVKEVLQYLPAPWPLVRFPPHRTVAFGKKREVMASSLPRRIVKVSAWLDAVVWRIKSVLGLTSCVWRVRGACVCVTAGDAASVGGARCVTKKRSQTLR